MVMPIEIDPVKRRPRGKVRRSPLKPLKPQKTQKGVGRPKPGSKPKGPVGGPAPRSRTIKPKLGIPPKMPVTTKAMGGQAREGAARAQLQKARKTERQKELMDMLNRLYGKQKIVPKKKPKKEK